MERVKLLVALWDTLPARYFYQILIIRSANVLLDIMNTMARWQMPACRFSLFIVAQMLKANKGWRAEDIKEMYKGCLPFSYMTKACNHRGSNMTDSNLPECTYEFNSCKSENQESGSKSRRKRSTEEPAECLTEASGKDYRGSVGVTASGKIAQNSIH